MRPRLRWTWLALVTTAALTAGAVVAVSALGGAACVTGQAGPNILLILTDDQRWDTLGAMPNVQRLLAANGVTFTNAFVPDPLCCPSRATVLTGTYAHTHQVWLNQPPMGGFPRFHDGSTIATWLRSAGFHTALFGKYLNGYTGTYVPPGWDRWAAIAASDSVHDLYYRYALNVDGRLEPHGGLPADYSTTVLGERAVDYICHTAGRLFVYFAPFAPHSPYWQGPGDRYPGPLPERPPSFDEEDVSDKPGWVRNLPRLTGGRARKIEHDRRAAAGTLVAVDRAVGDLVAALRRTGRLSDTLIVFTSDNGFAWGEHRWIDKIAPYEESIRVPLVVRSDRLVRDPGRSETGLVSLVDLAPTLAAWAGVPAPGADGLSFLPLLTDPGAAGRDEVLIEGAQLFGVPSYCGVRSKRYKYVSYATGDEELYDLRGDPFEMENRARDPRFAGPLERLRTRAGELCTPPPPGFASPPGGG